MNKNKSVIAIALSTVFSGAASAEMMLPPPVRVDAVPGTISVAQAVLQGILPNPDWDALGATTALALGSNILKVIDRSRVEITFSFIYTEAAWYDEFIVGGNKITNRGGADQQFTVEYDFGDTLDFAFTSLAGDEATPRRVANGANQFAADVQDRGDLNFAYVDLGDGQFLLGFEDGLVEEPNGSDWDDLVIKGQARITAIEVPEPGPVALLGLGVVGVVLTRIKHRQAA